MELGAGLVMARDCEEEEPLGYRACGRDKEDVSV